MYSSYTYAVARIRALENKLLTRIDADKLLVGTTDDFINLLKAADYGGITSTNITDIDTVLNNEMNMTYRVVYSLSKEKDKNLITLFYRRSEFYNTYKPAQEPYLAERQFWQELLLATRNSKSTFLTQLVEILIDLINIKTYFRVGKFNLLPSERISEVMIPGGKLSFELWSITSPELFFKKLRSTSYNIFIKESIEKDYDLSGLEVLCNNYIIDFISQSKYYFFTIEPLVTYLFYKEQETKMLRSIWYGLKNNLLKDIIKQHLTKLYA